MRILYDHQCFAMQDYGGISRYHYQLIKELGNLPDVNVKLSLTHSNNLYIQNDSDLKVKAFYPTKDFYFKKTILDRINRISTISALKEGDYDVFHPTYYNPYFLKFLNNKPFIFTIHDMIYELYPEINKGIDRSRTQKKTLLKAAKFIIVPSDNSKKDLIRLYNVTNEKIDVIYLAASIHKNMAIPKEELNLPGKYILFVGKRDYYKNFNNFFLAIAPLLITHSNLFLIVAGGGGFTKEEYKFFESKKLINKILYKKVNDSVLATLYSNAVAFVFPTLFEGFGITALEAMNCDCPVIMSSTSSLPEVGGDAAIYFDPNNLADIREKIEMVIIDAELRKELIKKALVHRDKFSFTKTAIQTKATYARILNK